MNKSPALFPPAFWAFALSLLASVYVHFFVQATWVEQKTTVQVFVNNQNQHYFLQDEKTVLIPDAVPYEKSPLRQHALDQSQEKPAPGSQWVFEIDAQTGEKHFSTLKASPHFGAWSLLPALVAIGLCFLTREPLSSLFAGMMVGAFMLGKFNLLDEVLVPAFVHSQFGRNPSSLSLATRRIVGRVVENRRCRTVR